MGVYKTTSEQKKEYFKKSKNIAESLSKFIAASNYRFEEYVRSHLYCNDIGLFLKSMTSNEIHYLLSKIAATSSQQNIQVIYKGETQVQAARIQLFRDLNKDKIVDAKFLEEFFGMEFMYLFFAKLAYIERFSNALNLLEHIFIDQATKDSLNVSMTYELFQSMRTGYASFEELKVLKNSNSKEELQALKDRLQIPEISNQEVLSLLAKQDKFKDLLTSITSENWVYKTEFVNGKEVKRLDVNEKKKLSLIESTTNVELRQQYIDELNVKLSLNKRKVNELNKLVAIGNFNKGIFKRIKNSALNDSDAEIIKTCLIIQELEDKNTFYEVQQAKCAESISQILNAIERVKHLFLEDAEFCLSVDKEKIEKRIEEMEANIRKYDLIEQLTQLEKKREIRAMYMSSFDNYYKGFSKSIKVLNELTAKSDFICKFEIETKLNNCKISFKDILFKAFETESNENILLDYVINELNENLNEKFELFESVVDDFVGTKKIKNKFAKIHDLVVVAGKKNKMDISDEEKDHLETLFKEVFIDSLQPYQEVKNLKRAV